MDERAAMERPAQSYPPAISIRELGPWCVFAAAWFLVMMFLVGVDGGALSFGPGHFIHELMHDGRHLLSFPCH